MEHSVFNAASHHGRRWDLAIPAQMASHSRICLLSPNLGVFPSILGIPRGKPYFVRVQKSAPCDYGQRSDERQSRRSLGAAGARAQSPVKGPFVRAVLYSRGEFVQQ